MAVILKEMLRCEVSKTDTGRDLWWKSGKSYTSGTSVNLKFKESIYSGNEATKISGKYERTENGFEVWLYKKKFYQTSDFDLGPDDVIALINEGSNRRRLQLEKAHSLQAMTAELDSKAKRQPIPQETKTLVWQRDQGRCVECNSKENLEFDHIIPFSMGGSNTIRNLQLLCEACNRRKGATLG
jgi:hypothetical protein